MILGWLCLDRVGAAGEPVLAEIPHERYRELHLAVGSAVYLTPHEILPRA